MGNNTSQSLITISKAKGWDPQRIWNQDTGEYEQSIESWDHVRGPHDRGLGQVPGDNPLPAVHGGSTIAARDPRIPGRTGDPAEHEPFAADHPVTWNHPSVSESRANLKPSGELRTGMNLLDTTPTWSVPQPSKSKPSSRSPFPGMPGA